MPLLILRVFSLHSIFSLLLSHDSHCFAVGAGSTVTSLEVPDRHGSPGRESLPHCHAYKKPGLVPSRHGATTGAAGNGRANRGNALRTQWEEGEGRRTLCGKKSAGECSPGYRLRTGPRAAVSCC